MRATTKRVNAPIGKRVIVRSAMSGVHHGILVAVDRDIVTLSDSERLWYWKVAKMTGQVSSCSELATYGMDRAGTKVGARLSWIMVLGVNEIIPVAQAALGSYQ